MASILSNNNLRTIADNSELLIRVYRPSGPNNTWDLLGGSLWASVSIRSFAVLLLEAIYSGLRFRSKTAYSIMIFMSPICIVSMRNTRYEYHYGIRKFSGVVDGLTSRLGLWLGGGAAGSIPRSAFVFCGGENVCVHSLCMGVGVHTALLAFTQLSSVTEGFKLCWRTGQKLTLKPSFLTNQRS